PITHHPNRGVMFIFFLKKIICKRSKTYILNLHTCFFPCFTYSSFGKTFTKFYMSTWNRPRSVTMRSFTLHHDELSFFEDKYSDTYSSDIHIIVIILI